MVISAKILISFGIYIFLFLHTVVLVYFFLNHTHSFHITYQSFIYLILVDMLKYHWYGEHVKKTGN